MKTKRVAVAYIKDENDNLLMGRRNDNGKFTNPAGHANKNEDIHEAMARELMEETGLEAKSMKLLNVVKRGNLMIYLFDVKIDRNQAIDTSQDPDLECLTWEHIDPLTVVNELHVPIEHNIALKHWANS